MRQRPRRPLSVRDVGELLRRSVQTRDVILVGGQALNVWAVHLGLAAEHAVMSDDIDFFGSSADAVAASRDWNADVSIPTFDDHTPNSAVVIVNLDDEERGIDFMNSIAGVDSDELRQWASTLRGDTYQFQVMNPLHVLQSQLENVYGSLRRRNEDGGEYFATRVALAVNVAAGAIAEMLNSKRQRDSLDAAERVADMARQRPALEAWSRDGIDVLKAIPEHGAWPAAFNNRRLPQIRELVAAKRHKHAGRS